MDTTIAVVKEVIINTPTVKTIVMEPARQIDFKPGQWIYVFAGNNGQTVKRAYSIASPPGSIRLCVKRVDGGFMSNYLCSLKPGDKVEIAGPFGIFTLKETGKDTIFVATGTGIAPYMSMIPVLAGNGYKGKIKVVFGVRERGEILYAEEMKRFAKTAKLDFIPVLSRDPLWGGEEGHVQDILKKIADPQKNEVYICGLMQMVTETRKLLEGMGFQKGQVHFENYI